MPVFGKMPEGDVPSPAGAKARAVPPPFLPVLRVEAGRLFSPPRSAGAGPAVDAPLAGEDDGRGDSGACNPPAKATGAFEESAAAG